MPLGLKLQPIIPQPKMLLLPPLALRKVIAKENMGVYASSDTLYKGAVFGRDSLEVAEDLLAFKPDLARKIILTLAALQGIETNRDNEEEPGKIIHEYRKKVIGKRPIDKTSLSIFEQLARKWGGGEDELAYYGSVDETPHYLRTIGLYVEAHGRNILSAKVNRRDGSEATVLESAHDAADWLMRKLESSQSGMVEFHRLNPKGLLNQVWKDSDEFYIHENGDNVNHDGQIASVEVQGLAYDALLAAADILPHDADRYKRAAEHLKKRLFELLWLPEERYFALGIDYDKDGQMRLIRTRTANPGALLDTHLFDHMKPEDKQPYIEGIVRVILGNEFLTDAGIRSRSLKQGNLISYWDYHGSFVSWPKETYDIAKGLRRQGFTELGKQLENRMINVLLKNRDYPEFVFVDEYGRVLESKPATHSHGHVTVVDSSNNPEHVQAWTVSAMYAITYNLLRTPILRGRQRRPHWVSEVETDILRTIPKVNLFLNPFALSARYPTYHYRLKK